MEQPIYVIYAHFEAKPEHAQLVKSILSSLVEPTQKEQGCLKYELYSANAADNKFLLHEYWQNEDAHTYHMTMPYVQAWQARKKELLENYTDIILFKQTTEL